MLPRGCSIVIVRRKNGTFRESKPCKNCCEIIKKNNYIRWVIYSTDAGVVRVKSSNLTNDHITSGHRKSW